MGLVSQYDDIASQRQQFYLGQHGSIFSAVCPGLVISATPTRNIYNKTAWAGWLTDKDGQRYSRIERGMSSISPLEQRFDVCSEFCRPKIVPGYVGFSYNTQESYTWCHCHYDHNTIPPPGETIRDFSQNYGVGPAMSSDGDTTVTSYQYLVSKWWSSLVATDNC